ncbi:alpha/beta fold hydrolase [Streptomyces sp. NPDC056660]|uniref:alpha/beta fold hydrolase n=1 Tax=Streptomyces sp. NPDC056660 TaxID=3345897 RepID=UPI00369DFCAE
MSKDKSDVRQKSHTSFGLGAVGKGPAQQAPRRRPTSTLLQNLSTAVEKTCCGYPDCLRQLAAGNPISSRLPPDRYSWTGFANATGKSMNWSPPACPYVLSAAACVSTARQSGAYFLDALDVPSVAELGIPALYILGQDDCALPLPGAEFAARLGLEPVMVPGTHEGMLTHPDEVAKAILNG